MLLLCYLLLLHHIPKLRSSTQSLAVIAFALIRRVVKMEPTTTSSKRRDVKAFPEVSPWKLAMKAKLEQRVRESRAKIAAAARGKQSGVADVLMDMVRDRSSRVARHAGYCDELPLTLDSDQLSPRAPMSIQVAEEDATRRDLGLEGDGDEHLSNADRLAILLFLEETFYSSAKAEGMYYRHYLLTGKTIACRGVLNSTLTVRHRIPRSLLQPRMWRNCARQRRGRLPSVRS
jgi:hypothetical protein